MKPKEFCAVPAGRLRDMLPEGHPAAEDSRLTLFQQQAYPVLLWFFDILRNRATGRSHLMAHVLIELAMRGQEVVLEDLSTAPHERTRNYRGNRRFADQVLALARTAYPGQYFSYRLDTNTLTYVGRRP